MKFHCIVTGAFQTNCYVISNPANECLIVDPGDDADLIDGYIRDNALTVIGYPITHGHVDHVSALAEMHRRHPAPIGMHPLDLRWAFSSQNAMPPFFSAPGQPDAIEREYDDDQVWEDGGMSYRVLLVPGHAPGHVVFYFESEGVLIAGDTLFQGSIGRLDLPGGNEGDMIKSLTRLCALPDDTQVFPGHGPGTTIGREKQSNMFVLRYGIV